jgi:hypothetical protein
MDFQASGRRLELHRRHCATLGCAAHAARSPPISDSDLGCPPVNGFDGEPASANGHDGTV